MKKGAEEDDPAGAARKARGAPAGRHPRGHFPQFGRALPLPPVPPGGLGDQKVLLLLRKGDFKAFVRREGAAPPRSWGLLKPAGLGSDGRPLLRLLWKSEFGQGALEASERHGEHLGRTLNTYLFPGRSRAAALRPSDCAGLPRRERGHGEGVQGRVRAGRGLRSSRRGTDPGAAEGQGWGI